MEYSIHPECLFVLLCSRNGDKIVDRLTDAVAQVQFSARRRLFLSNAL